ncbi:MAG TPA: phytanoyl-CoA dioxygenase family protein [Candidatus Dormibacteraeota bacterium]|nr:phytanoyl-CoA dioxygenase family protein [Candidatus Dormibacteraeota bacterium]
MLDPTTIQRHVAKIEADGYSIVENAIEPDFVDALVADLGRLERELEVVPAKNRFEGTRTVRIYNLLIYGKLYERIPVHENVLPIVERVLDPGCLVSSLSSIAICNDEKPQPLHADDQLIPLPRPHVPIVCNTMWALTDFTDANGATRIVPGSHKWAELPDYFGKHDSIPAEMPKGSVMVYNGSLWHGGGSNRTSARRIGVAMNYCAGFIRQQENQQLGIPREIAAQFTPRLQELVGYSLYNGLIGHIDKSHPMELLGRSPETTMVWDVVAG